MNGRRPLVIVALVVAIGPAVAMVRQQGAPDAQLPGAGMTRQQVIDKLTAADYQPKPPTGDGRVLFQGLCANCHIVGDIGTSVGPDLSTLSSRFRKRDLLEAILFPSRTISDQYAMQTLTLDDGTTVTGLVAREDAQFVFLRSDERPGGRGVPVPIARIKDRRDAEVSMMPDGLVAGLTLDQIDSLVAFLLASR